MAEAVVVQLATAISSEIADHDFGIPFESELSYADASRELKDLSGVLHIDVVPWRCPLVELATRGTFLYRPAVDIVIRKVFPALEHNTSTGQGEVKTDEVNRLLKLVEDVEEFFTPSQLTGNTGSLADYPGATWKETDRKMDYNRPHLYTKSQFTAWIRVTYEVDKEPG